MSKYSPGPWNYRRVKYETYAILDERGTEVAVITRPYDAAIIAAAPEMYELLLEAIPLLPDYTEDLQQCWEAIHRRINGK